MREGLLKFIACPACRGKLALTRQALEGTEIWEGELLCTRCDESYSISHGMPLLYVEDERWTPKAREAQGWVEIYRKSGLYEPVEDAEDLKLPYCSEDAWISIAQTFEKALDILQLDGSETILDLGAGRGWAAKQFALRGCQVVALDIVVDECIGLGRARILMEHASVYFERVIGDGQNLPFDPDTFDIVFCCGTLHHAEDLPLFMVNIARVLRPEGRLCAIYEPCIGLAENEDRVLSKHTAQELELGINETRPNINDYLDALETADLTPMTVIPRGAYGMDLAQIEELAKDRGAIWGWPDLRRPKRSFWRGARFTYRRIQALANRMMGSMLSPPSANPWQNLAYKILLWSGGELFLLVHKSSSND
jgi:SAM-dependent methyltransferase